MTTSFNALIYNDKIFFPSKKRLSQEDRTFPYDRVGNATAVVRLQMGIGLSLAYATHVEGGMAERIAIIQHAQKVVEEEYNKLLAEKQKHCGEERPAKRRKS